MSRRPLAAVLCVLLLNMQLFATNALGCVHSAEPEAAGPHCAQLALHGDAATDGNGADLATDSPCQKCNLGTVAAGWHLLGTTTPALAVAPRDHPIAHTSPQLRTPAPDSLLRPPRHISV
jgi:hypothetical protein